MPILSGAQLAALRLRQEDAANENQRCDNCLAQIWPNYCRECDEFFMDGHYSVCAKASKHQEHRRY